MKLIRIGNEWVNPSRINHISLLTYGYDIWSIVMHFGENDECRWDFATKESAEVFLRDSILKRL